MTFTAESLADGQVSNVKATLYTSVDRSAIRYVSFHNTDPGTQTIVAYVNRGTSRVVRTIVLLQNESYNLFAKEGGLSMSAGDLIEAETTTAAVVDYMVTGATAP